MTQHPEGPKVRSVVEDRVARITFSDPATRNAFSAPFLAQLHQALDEATARADVGSILISAEGPDFSAGGYLPDLAALPTKTLAETEADGRPIAELFKRLAVTTKPVIAAVHGAAFGGGCGLACVASITLASHEARFGCPELRLGLFPFLIMPALRHAVGDRNALELALSCRILTASEAVRLGLVTRSVPADQLKADALDLARRVAESSPDSLRLGLRAFYETAEMPIRAAIDRNLEIRTECCQSPNVSEGIQAFFEKRPPRWDFSI